MINPIVGKKYLMSQVHFILLPPQTDDPSTERALFQCDACKARMSNSEIEVHTKYVHHADDYTVDSRIRRSNP